MDITDIQNALDENASWFVESSVSKCGAWITAATQLLGRAEESQRNGQGVGARLRMNLEQIRTELVFARKWYTNNRPTTANTARFHGVEFNETDQRR